MYRYNTGDVLSRSNRLASWAVRECSKTSSSAKIKVILSSFNSTVFRPPQPANATAPLSSGRTVHYFSAHPSEKLWCVNVKTMIWASWWSPQSSDSEANSTLVISKEQHTKRSCRLKASVTEHHFHQLKWQTAAVAGRTSCRQLTLIPRVTW